MTAQRVAIVYRLDRMGGVQSCCFSLIRGLNRCGIVPDVLWDVEPAWSLFERHKIKAGFRRIRFPFPTLWIDRLPDSLRYLAWLFNVIRGEHFSQMYDFFYLFFNGFLVPPQQPHLYYLSGPPLISALKNIPSGLRGAPIQLFQSLYRGLLRSKRPVYEYHADCRYVINSHFTGELFEKEHGVRLPVVHPPIVLSGRGYASGDLEQRDSMIFFSRFADYKRPEMVLELAARHSNLRCVLMGAVPGHRRPYFEALKAQAVAMGLKEVVFLANPPEQQVREELARARFYIFPAIREHFGMTTVESIASGVIPFVHDSGGQREIVPDISLRFSDAEFYTKFAALVDFPLEILNEKRLALAGHIRQYSEEVYIDKMLAYLERPA